MQFFITNVFLAALTLGVGSSTGDFIDGGDNDNDDEAGRFWRTLIEDLDSMPTKAQISSKPSSKPDDIPSAKPSLKPFTAGPTSTTNKPSEKPTLKLFTAGPTATPDKPSGKPSLKPFTTGPTATPNKPSGKPSLKPFTAGPTTTPETPSGKPSLKPFTTGPTAASNKPSGKPSLKPFTAGPTTTPVSPTPAPITSAPATSAPSLSSCQSIEKLVCSVPEFSTLCDLSQAAGLGDALNNDIFTLFAPTNVAFDLVPTEIIDAITDVEALRKALLYHAVPEVILRSEDLVCGAEVMMANRNDTITTCINDEIYQVGSGNTLGALPRIVAPDGVACNGIIHVIDQVILQGIITPTDPPTTKPDDPTLSPVDPIPSPIDPTPLPTPEPTDLSPITFEPTSTCQSISEVVCTLPEFEILCALVGDADLVDALRSEDKFTLFAPMNTAFESLPQEVADKVTGDMEFLKNVLLSHVVADNEVFSTDLVCNEKVIMANGDKTTTICTGDKIYQAGAGNTPNNIPEVIAPDGVGCNGVIHAIDHVILPGGDSPPSSPPGSSYCTQSPDMTCYRSGWPVCCEDDSIDCPKEKPPCELPPASCKSIAEVVCTLPEFEILCSLVGDANLVDVLGDSKEKMTLFAPINTAFESLSPEVTDKVNGDVEFLRNILLSHAVTDNEVFSIDLACNEKVVMANGDRTTTICTGDKIYQVGAGNTPEDIPEIIAPDGVGCNGVIHAIDHVILPSVDTLPSSPPGPSAPDALPVVKDIISKFLLNDGVEFDDESSYQYQAINQTASQVGAESFSEVQIVQYYVLYCIYYATNMVPNEVTMKYPQFELPKWENEEGWNENDRDPCDGWLGIECDSEGRVKNIDLFRNELTGSFPPEVVLLSFDGSYANGSGKLERLDLTGNEWLFNNNDSSWMTDLGKSIETISVEDTSFGGSIPRLPDGLVNFDISGSFFDDGLDDANFEGLELLNFVDLDYNMFDSSIPSVFGRLPNLEFLYVSSSFIKGDLSFMNGMPVLRELWIDNNPLLSGSLYGFIGDITTLESFSATFGNLTGSIPESFGNLANMKQMWLYSNLLSGSVPPQLGALKAMKALQVEGNLLTGVMPEEVCANIGDPLEVLGADCQDSQFECPCCTCCGLEECNEQP